MGVLPEHEQLVAEFMAEAQRRNPLLYALICQQYPVKSARQMRRSTEIEIPVGLYPEIREESQREVPV